MEIKICQELPAAEAPNTCQRLLNTHRGEYLIQVSWPLGWTLDETPDVTNVPVIYLVDGNAYFFTATDIIRRLQFSFGKKAVVVGIGYPITNAVYAPSRRSLDLTPPSKKGLSPPPGRDGKPQDPASFGGADGFHDVLESVVMPLVEREILPTISLGQMRSVLFGHSFGGLFTLYSLFTRPGLFDTYIAASPSIWWNDCSIVKEQERDFESKNPSGEKERGAPHVIEGISRLFITYGLQEQDVVKKPYESDEEFEKRQKQSAKKRMASNALKMATRLEASKKLDEIWVQAFEGDDHGCAAVSGLQRALVKVFGEWSE